jgi:GntR family transcriptional regulator
LWRRQKSTSTGLVSFTEQMATRGFSAHSRVLSAQVTTGEDEVGARLGVAAGTRLIRLERLRMADGQPFAIETCYLAADPVPAAAEMAS